MIFRIGGKLDDICLSKSKKMGKSAEVWVYANHVRQEYDREANKNTITFDNQWNKKTQCYERVGDDTHRFVLDIDSPQLISKLGLIHLEDMLLQCRKAGLLPFIVVETSPSRFHILFDGEEGVFDGARHRLIMACRLFGVEFDEDIEALIKRLEIEFGIDPQSFNEKIAAHSFRLGGSVNNRSCSGFKKKQVIQYTYPVKGHINRRHIYSPAELQKIEEVVTPSTAEGGDATTEQPPEASPKTQPEVDKAIFEAAKEELMQFHSTDIDIGRWGDFEKGCIAALIADHWLELITKAEMPMAWKWFVERLKKGGQQATALRNALKDQGFFEVTKTHDIATRRCEYVTLGGMFKKTASLIHEKAAKFKEVEYTPHHSAKAICADTVRFYFTHRTRFEAIDHVWQRYSEYVTKHPERKKWRYQDIESKVTNLWTKLEKKKGKSYEKKEHTAIRLFN